jgi:hypothetical protein
VGKTTSEFPDSVIPPCVLVSWRACELGTWRRDAEGSLLH